MQLAIIAAIFFAVASVLFALQNNVPVTVAFLLWRFDGSLALVLLLAVAAGATIVALLTTPSTVHRQWQASRQKRRIEDLEKENKGLREHITELERNRPAPMERSAGEPPYVGLKQIVMTGRGGADGEEDKGGN